MADLNTGILINFSQSYDYKAAGLGDRAKEKSSEKLNENTFSNFDTSAFEADYYLSALFNIETSPGFRALDLIKRDVPEEKYKEISS